MNEVRFLTPKEITRTIKNIAYDHDCKIIEIKPIICNRTGRIINYFVNIDCPKETELECAMALEDRLGEYLAEPPKQKRILKGWPV